MAGGFGPVHVSLNCIRCGRLKRPEKMIRDRHNKHYCQDCAKKIDLCGVCGSTKVDDDTLYGQLHYDDWCFD